LANRLNANGSKPPQSETLPELVIYCLLLRLRHFSPNAHNLRTYSEAEYYKRIVELLVHRQPLRQTTAALNKQGWLPIEGRNLAGRSVHALLKTTDATNLLNLMRYLELRLTRMERAHELGWKVPDSRTFLATGLSEAA